MSKHSGRSITGQMTDTNNTTGRNAVARRRLRLASDAAIWERLEHRTLMSASTWTGAGTDPNFSTAANWAATAAPAPGDDVSFGGGVASYAVTVDAPTTVGAVSFTANGFGLSGADALTVTGGIAATGGNDTVWAPVTLGAPQTVSADAGDTLTLAGDVDDGGNGYGLTKTGGGYLSLAGTETFAGPVNVAAGTLRVDGLLLSDVNLAPGSTLSGTGLVGPIISTGGVIVPGDSGTGDGTITSTGGMTLDASSGLVLSLDGNTPGNGVGNYGQVSTGGDVALNGATLSLSLGSDYAPAAGDTLTLINNGGSNPVTGTFAGLPEGSLLTVGGSTFRISYAGGDGNDVTLGYVRSAAVSLTSDAAPGHHGQTVTFTAAVTPTDGSPGTPTGTVTFYDNGASLGAAQAVDGSGNATLAVSNLSGGTHAITAVYSGDTDFQTATSATLSQVISPAATATTLASSTSGASVFGQAVTFTANVAVTGAGTGTPSGTVTFMDGATPLGTVALNGSAGATYATAALSTASHSITAVYNGASDFATSTSSVTTQAVTKATSAVALTSNMATSVFGQAITYTATATAVVPGAGTPTGTITFKDGGTTLGTATLNNAGIATYTGTTLATGSHTVTAVYGGNTNFLTVTSGGSTQTVSQAATRAVVTSSLGTSVFGQSVTLNVILASVAPGSGLPTGTVTFYDGGASLGAATISSGRATLPTAALAVGSHSITVAYAGDANHAAVTSAVFTQHVNKAALSVAVSSSAGSAVWGESVDYTVTANAAAPGAGTPDGGTVTLTDENGTMIGTGTLASGTVTITGTPLAIGTHTVTATYAGDGSFSGGSGTTAEAVAKAGTTVAMSSSGSPNVAGQPLTFTAAVSVDAPGAGTVTGTVKFYDGDLNHLIGTATVSAGSASYSTASFPTGSHSVFAIYGGDAHLLATASPPLTQAANQDATTTVVVSGNASSVYGQALALTATVSPAAPGGGTPTGTVTFYNGGMQIGSPVALVNGTATIHPPHLPVGSDSITAVYGGDTDYTTSTSAPITQTVAQGTTAAVITATASPSVFGQSVTFTATVSVATGAGTPSGTVAFSIDGTPATTVTIASDGTATLTVSNLSAASHAIDAVYSGDVHFVGSTATTFAQTVNAAATTTTVTSSAASAPSGVPVTLTATVAPVAPGTGVPVGATVTFISNGSSVGTGTVQSDGTATLTGVTPAVGSHAITATVAADANHATSTSAPYTQAVTQGTTTLTMGATAGTVYGQSAALTATVAVAAGAGTPTGTVTFYDGVTSIGTATLSGATATLSTGALSTGDHTITAVYAGDANFAGATTASGVTQHVARATTDVSFTSSDAANAVWGEAVSYTVTVTAAAPGAGTPDGGTVTMYDYYGDVLGTGTLVNGTVTIAGGQLPIATSTMHAEYAGDANFTAGASATASQVVTADTTTTSVTSSQGTTAFGQSVTFTANVTADAPGTGTPTGLVTFYADGFVIGTAQPLAGDGSASVTVNALAVGSPTITAQFSSADNFFDSSTSGNLTQAVTPAATTVSLASSNASAVFGQPVTVTATVAPAAGSAVPTGTITFLDTGVAIGSPVAVDGFGHAAITMPFALGSHPLTADFDNTDGNFVTSTTAAPLAQSVAQDTVTVGVAASTTTPVHGQPLTITATVAAAAPGTGTPTGTVTFLVDTVPVGTGTLSGGVATFTTSSLATVPHDLTVTYAGDSEFLAGASADHAVDVTVGQAATTLTMGATTGTSYGATATFTATVAAVAPGVGVPTGTVTFYADGNTASPLGTATVDGSGMATLATSVLMIGNHAITATYAGDGDFLTSTVGSAATQTVVASSTTTTLSQLSSNSQYNTPAHLAATVAPVAPGGGTPTGIVDFFDGQTLLGTGTLVGGQATLAAWGLSVGAHSVRAVYTGDQANNYLTSASTIATHTVALGSTTAGLTSSVNPSAVGQQVTFTAAVASSFGVYGAGVAPIGGTFTFYDNGVSIGTAAVDSTGHATFATAALAVAGHPITATYGGDAHYATSTASAVTQTVQQGTVTVAVSSSAATTAVFGQSVTLTAAVNAVLPATGNPTGTVTFFSDGVQVGAPATIAAGQAQVSTAGLTVGSHAITVTYNGDGNFVAGTSVSFAQAVNPDGSAVAVISSQNPAVAGQTVRFTATVSAAAPGAGVPSGTVTFYADGNAIGSAVTLSGGTAFIDTAALSTSTHTVTAVYSGDASFTTSTSGTLTQSQNQDPTAVALTTSASSGAYGQGLTLTATVTAAAPGSGTPTGAVSFYDVATGTPVFVGQGTMTGGVATLVNSTLHVGTYSITATYGGDANFATATSSASPLTVTAAGTTTTLSGDASGVYGQAMSLIATVAPVAPGGGTLVGTVAFYDAGGTVLLGSATLTGGVATLAQPLAVGSHGVTAVFTPGSSDYTSSAAASRTVAVSRSATTTTLSAPTATVFGQAATITATVAATAPGAGTATGSVAFYAGATLLQTVNLDGNGQATLTTAGLTVGSHAITAQYSGDGNFLTGGPSVAVTQIVAKGTLSGVVTASSAATTVGDPVTFTATFAAVAPAVGVPTGTVTFYDGPTSIGTGTLDSNGLATLALNSLTVGSHAITAQFAGDGDFNGATSASLSHAVTPAAVTTTLTPSAGPSAWGQSVTLTATVTAPDATGIATGTVTFNAGSVVLGQGTLDSNGVATIATSVLAVGTDAITATYSGDTNHVGGTSAPVGQTVAQAATTVALNATTPTLAGNTTLTATIAAVAPGAGSPTGTVNFYDGSALIGSVPFTGGLASLAGTGLAGGDHAFSAIYGGDANFLSATSPAITAHVPLPGTLAFSTASETISEAASTAQITVARTGGSEGAVSVDFAIAGGSAAYGSNYQLAGGTLQFADGQSSVTISVPVLDDGRYDQDKTLVLNLSNPTGGAAVGATATNTLTITNVDAAPTVSIGNATVTASPTGNALAVFPLNLSAPSNLPLTVHYRTVDGTATAGADYAPVDGVAYVPAGATSIAIGISALPTTAYNPTRTFSLVPYGPQNATVGASGTGTILNTNYPLPTVANVSATVAPGAAATFSPLGTARAFDGNALTLSALTQPANGSIVLTNNVLTYTPAPGSFAGDTFTYMVTDDKGGTAVGTATVNVQGTGLVASPTVAGASDLVVVGTAGNDTITFKPVANVRNGVRVTVNGVTSATFAVTGRLVALGGDGADSIVASGTSQNAWFYGGTGNDTLTGGAANDVLVGGDGNDVLTGGAGRNILLGGNGADSLKGSGSADILVADATSYDAPTVAGQVSLATLQTNWVVRKVRPVTVSSGLNTRGGPALSTATITPDASADVLVGKKSDWYFGDFTFAGGTTTFADGRHAKAGQLLTPTNGELVTNL